MILYYSIYCNANLLVKQQNCHALQLYSLCNNTVLNNKLHFLAQEVHHQALYKAKENMLLVTYFTFLIINIIIIITCNNIFYISYIFM